MATTFAAPAKARQETAEESFQRLLKESQDLNPQPVGTAEEIRRDTLGTYKAWSKLRRRFRKTA